MNDREEDAASSGGEARGSRDRLRISEASHAEELPPRGELKALELRIRALEGEVERRREAEAALRDALGERGRVEEGLRVSLEREKAARARAEANDEFKETFLGILSHDLRNPLNTVLTTARLMAMKAELPPECLPKVDRIVAGGVRIERLLDQLLDLTRARLAGGIPVTLGAEEELVPIVAGVLAEARAAYPARDFDLRVDGPCRARVDRARFEQALLQLLANAVVHGAKEHPITVELDATADGEARLRIHNEGPPIDAQLLPLLFDPFKRAQHPRGARAGGLGLGLYVTERIVFAHGGTITVESSASAGTRVEIRLPRST